MLLPETTLTNHIPWASLLPLPLPTSGLFPYFSLFVSIFIFFCLDLSLSLSLSPAPSLSLFPYVYLPLSLSLSLCLSLLLSLFHSISALSLSLSLSLYLSHTLSLPPLCLYLSLSLALYFTLSLPSSHSLHFSNENLTWYPPNIQGIYNFCNPGAISHNEVLDLYKKHIDPSYVYTNFSLDEQAQILKAGRSNNTLGIYLSIYKYLPNYLSIYLSMYLSICLSIDRSIYLCQSN